MDFEDSSDSSEWIFINTQCQNNDKHLKHADGIKIQKSNEVVILKEHFRLVPTEDSPFKPQNSEQPTSQAAPRMYESSSPIRKVNKKRQSCFQLDYSYDPRDDLANSTLNYQCMSIDVQAQATGKPNSTTAIEIPNRSHEEELKFDPVINFQEIAGKEREVYMSPHHLAEIMPPSDITYSVHRIQSFGKKLAFQLMKKNEIVYEAFFKSSNFYLRAKNYLENSDTSYDAILKIGGFMIKTAKIYIDNDDYESNVMAEVKIVPGGRKTARRLEFSFTRNTPENYVTQLVSRKPTFNEENNEWQLDFFGRTVVKSIKNAILDGDGLRRAISIRKTSKDDLEIDLLNELDPMYIISLGIISFVC